LFVHLFPGQGGLVWLHASRGRRLLHADASPAIVRAVGRRLIGGTALCAVITLLALIQVDLSLVGCGLVLAYYGISDVRKDDRGEKSE